MEVFEVVFEVVEPTCLMSLRRMRAPTRLPAFGAAGQAACRREFDQARCQQDR